MEAVVARVPEGQAPPRRARVDLGDAAHMAFRLEAHRKLEMQLLQGGKLVKAVVATPHVTPAALTTTKNGKKRRR